MRIEHPADKAGKAPGGYRCLAPGSRKPTITTSITTTTTTKKTCPSPSCKPGPSCEGGGGGAVAPRQSARLLRGGGGGGHHRRHRQAPAPRPRRATPSPTRSSSRSPSPRRSETRSASPTGSPFPSSASSAPCASEEQQPGSKPEATKKEVGDLGGSDGVEKEPRKKVRRTSPCRGEETLGSCAPSSPQLVPLIGGILDETPSTVRTRVIAVGRGRHVLRSEVSQARSSEESRATEKGARETRENTNLTEPGRAESDASEGGSEHSTTPEQSLLQLHKEASDVAPRTTTMANTDQRAAPSALPHDASVTPTVFSPSNQIQNQSISKRAESLMPTFSGKESTAALLKLSSEHSTNQMSVRRETGKTASAEAGVADFAQLAESPSPCKTPSPPSSPGLSFASSDESSVLSSPNVSKRKATKRGEPPNAPFVKRTKTLLRTPPRLQDATGDLGGAVPVRRTKTPSARRNLLSKFSEVWDRAGVDENVFAADEPPLEVRHRRSAITTRMLIYNQSADEAAVAVDHASFASPRPIFGCQTRRSSFPKAEKDPHSPFWMPSST